MYRIYEWRVFMSIHGPLDRLLEGNVRFISGERIGVSARWEPDTMVVSQRPFAAVLGCSDSRVPPEQIFDLGPGEIFVVRVAGNTAGPSEVSSLEYAVQHLGVSLVLVMGHEGCGAVKAALEEEGDDAAGDVVARIRPAVKLVAKQTGETADIWSDAVRANIGHTMSALIEQSEVIRESVKSGAVSLVGALFSLSSGRVSVLEERR
jgi:carbonic anhydrase